jgi:toxin ParE1/3/4
MIIIRPDAEDELNDAWEWYEERAPGLGERLRERVNETLERIEQNPLMYAKAFADIRVAPVKRFRYAVYYRLIGDKIVITAIMHTSRDPIAWKKRS